MVIPDKQDAQHFTHFLKREDLPV